jgi:NADPH-dependent glutamate synthase beta subunit-like oxidoreductase
MGVPPMSGTGILPVSGIVRGDVRVADVSSARDAGILPAVSSSSSSSSGAPTAPAAGTAAARAGETPVPHMGETPMPLKGKIVAVIGGGLTGEDCVQTALRCGAKEVHQFEILPKDLAAANGHASPFEEEPDHLSRRWCIATKGFGGDRRLAEMKAVQVQWESSARGPVLVELPETEFRMKVDLAVLALGFEPAVDEELARQLGVGRDAKGRALVDGCATTAPGVFVAGDLLSGPSYVATAIASGRKAAAKIDEFLSAPAPGE